MTWWQGTPKRLIQTNLREIDATLDVEAYVQSIAAFDGNVALFNVGGIVANYPTDLPFHYRNPHLRGDFTREVLGGLHAAGIRMIARFDFSKVNERYAADHPDWLYTSTAGVPVFYNGQVHVCVNSQYQQQHSLDILGEVIDRYPIDGVFFNMIGYQTRDYSLHYHGICQCDNCRRRFRDYCGAEVPTVEDAGDPVYRRYVAFTRDTAKELFDRIAAFVKGRREDIAICTYTPEGVDVYRKESNSGMGRPLPEWNYSATENVRATLDTWPGMQISNAAVHFVDYSHRHASVSPHLTALRLAQDLTNGGWLDYYVIGTLLNQDDRSCFDVVKDIYSFHREHEAAYTDLHTVADVCLIEPERSGYFGSHTEFKGLFRILSESHVLFDVLHDHVLDAADAAERLARYQVAVFPDVRNMTDAMVAAVDRYVAAGGAALFTGQSGTCDATGNARDRVAPACAGVAAINRTIPGAAGTYFRVRPADHTALGTLVDLDLVLFVGDFLDCVPAPGATAHLGYLPPVMFGPPEKCYPTEETDIPGLIVNYHGAGRSAYLPWEIGRHYERLSNHAHALLIRGVLEGVLGLRRSVAVAASPLVEVHAHRQGTSRRSLVHLVNTSGQLGTAFHAPLPIHAINIAFAAHAAPGRVTLLRGGDDVPWTYADGRIAFRVPALDLFETAVIVPAGA